MSDATIGALKVVLGLDSAQFENGLSAAQKQLRQAGREFQKVGRQVTDIGRNLSTAVTLPIIGLGVAVTKTAADFETAMNRVSISTGATGEKMRAMSDLAREIGRETVFSASTAADAMDMLAKAGVSVEDILGGAARAAVDLAAAAGTDLDPAAAAITDTMAQFKKTAEELPQVVNQITGAVNESKLDFSDFQLAMGQAGGVAANLGVSFEDFNAVLAGTSPLFSSGSDAGTSFKTFLQRLVPQTEKAATAIADLGLSFHDAQGNLRPMSDIAQQLQDKLSGLSDQAKTQALTDIFGTDAMRTAIALMDQGAAGLDQIAERIAATDAAAQAAKRMEGFNGQLEQMKGAFEELAIAIGQSGFLNMMTGLVKAVTGLMERLAAVNPAIVRVGLVVAGLAAAFGPVLMAVGAMVSSWGALVTALGTGGVLAGLGAALGSIAAVALPVVAVIGALAVAFYAFRDELEPIIREFGEAFMEAVGPAIPPLIEALKSAFAGLSSVVMGALNLLAPVVKVFAEAMVGAFGPIILTVVRTFVATLTSVFDILGQAFRTIGALLRGDWSEAWNAAGSLVMSVVRGFGRIIEAVFPGALGWMQKLYQGVREWIQNKLGAVFTWVSNKAREVGDAFFKLYDRVVGHSYVPDMVRETGEWFARLQNLMVVPATRATTTAADRFRQMREDIRGVLQGLMTDVERAELEYQDAMAKIAAARADPAADQAMLDEFARRARARRDAANVENLDPLPRIELRTLDEDGSIKRFQDSMREVQERIKDSREDFADAFAWGIRDAMDGDWKDLLKSIVGDIFDDSLRQVGRMLFNWAQKWGGDGQGGWDFAKIGATIASFFGGGAPKFATGGRILPGGAGGVDSQFVQFWKSPGEQVDIYTPGQDMGPARSITQNYFTGNLMTPEFWERINHGDMAAENRAHARSITDAPKLGASQAARQQEYAVGRKKR